MKLIQLSDCHLLADPEAKLKRVKPFHTLAKVCEAIQHKHADASALLLTGDLSQDGSLESYSHLANLLRYLAIPAFALPGNHDNWATLQQITVDWLHFEKSIMLNDWQILMLDSTVENQVAGKINNTELAWLKTQTIHPGAPSQLVALHHQPIPANSQWLNAIGVQNAGALWHCLKKAKQVKITIHGHIHQCNHQLLQHIDCYATPSTWRQFKPSQLHHGMDFLPPAYRVLQLAADSSHSSWVEFV